MRPLPPGPRRRQCLMFDQASVNPYDPESGEKPEPAQLFSIPGNDVSDPGPIAALLIEDPHFDTLRSLEPTILYLMRAAPKLKGCKTRLGEVLMPTGRGTAGEMFIWLLGSACNGLPDYVMVLDAAWWAEASDVQREALVFHELEHMVQATNRHDEPLFTGDGKPMFALRPHDIEEFNSVVERYGAWLPDVSAFATALRAGGV